METDAAQAMRKARKFYLIFCGALLAHSTIAFYRHHAFAGRISGILSICLLLIHFLAPAVSLTLYNLYTALLTFLGKQLTKLFMVLFFYVIFTPYGLLLRLLKGDLLHRRLEPARDSYWISREVVSSEVSDKRCENPF